MIIFKYPIPEDNEFHVWMPVGAEVLCVQVQGTAHERDGGKPCVWAMVDENATKERRRFRLLGTGHPLPHDDRHPMASKDEWRYVGTFQMHGGRLVLHLFVEVT